MVIYSDLSTGTELDKKSRRTKKPGLLRCGFWTEMRLQKKLNYFSSRQNPGVHEAGRVQKFDILSPELGHGWQNLPPTDISRVPTDISRVATDISRVATDISHAPTDISRVPTEISHALTDVSPRLTLAGARPIYWGFEIKWVFPGSSGSRCRRRFQPGDAISATGQASGIKPRKIRNTRTGYFQGDRLRPSGTPPGGACGDWPR